MGVPFSQALHGCPSTAHHPYAFWTFKEGSRCASFTNQNPEKTHCQKSISFHTGACEPLNSGMCPHSDDIISVALQKRAGILDGGHVKELLADRDVQGIMARVPHTSTWKYCHTQRNSWRCACNSRNQKRKQWWCCLTGQLPQQSSKRKCLAQQV